MALTPPPGSTMYTFGSIAFYRDVGDTFQDWFSSHTEYTRYVILDGSDNDAVHIGARRVGDELEIRAVVFSPAVRNQLETAEGTVAVLSKSSGESRDALLVKTARERGRTSGRYVVILTFLPRPVGSA